MRVVELTSGAFDQFSTGHKYSNLYQTSTYGNMMKTLGYDVFYLGVEDNNTLIAATLILSRITYLTFKAAYSPRGILVDYENNNLLDNVFSEIKRFLFKQRVMFLTMDPIVKLSHKLESGAVIDLNKKSQEIIQCLQNIGFDHLGFNNYFEGLLPRFEAILPLPIVPKAYFKKITKQARNKLRKSVKYGVDIYKDETLDYELLNSMLVDKYSHNSNYYKALCEGFKDNVEIYYAKVNTEKYVNNSKMLYEKEIDKNEYLNSIIQSNGYKGKDMRMVLNKKMESDKTLSTYKSHLVTSTQLLKDFPDGIIIAACIVIRYGKFAYIFEEDYNKLYKNIPALTFMKWKIIEKYSTLNLDILNMGALSGELDKKKNEYKGLNESKFNFKVVATEYIGQFELVINKPIYSLYSNSKGKVRFQL